MSVQLEKIISKPVNGSKLIQEITEAGLPLLGIVRYKTNSYRFRFSAAVKESTLDAVIAAHEVIPSLAEQIKATYSKHAQNGKAFFDDYRAHLIAEMMSGAYTEAQIINIDKHLVYVKSFILSGDWKTAKSKLQETPTTADFLQLEKDYLLNEIQTYIYINY